MANLQRLSQLRKLAAQAAELRMQREQVDRVERLRDFRQWLVVRPDYGDIADSMRNAQIAELRRRHPGRDHGYLDPNWSADAHAALWRRLQAEFAREQA